MGRRLSEVVKTLAQWVERGSHVHESAFCGVLKRCTAHKDLVLGSHVHALAVINGCESISCVANQIICMYASFKRLEEAMQVFSQVSSPNSHVWASIILAHARNGQPTKAINLYRQMWKSSTKPDSHVFVAVLKACATAHDLCAGREIHANVLRTPDVLNIFVGNCLVDMYSKCGSLDHARTVFNSLPRKDVVSWNIMMAAYARHGAGQEALALYADMQLEGTVQANQGTYVSLLQACSSIGSLQHGMQLHAHIREKGLEADIVIGTCLLHMYLNCRSLEHARSVFDNLPTRDVVTWTAMIAGYAHGELGEQSLALYARMQQEGLTPANHVTFVCLLQACSSMGALRQGKQLHAQIQEQGLQSHAVVGNCLVDMYAKCGSLEDAREVFANLPVKDVVTWNTMITAYTQHGRGQEALAMYSSMQQEGVSPADAVTFLCLLQACAMIRALPQGRRLHAQIKARGLEVDVVLGTSLVDMYAKCGSLEDALAVFKMLPSKNVVTWNAMLAGYTQHGHGEQALTVYDSQQQEGITQPDAITFVCVLQACAITGDLRRGKQIHSHVHERGLASDVTVCNSLVSMYAKCGSLVDARTVFDSLSAKDVGTWNAMLCGYAREELGQEALTLFGAMQQEGITQANTVTYVCLLQACATIGALQQGKQLHSQIEASGIEVDVVVGTCLVNMYSKCGSLEDARRVFDNLAAKDFVTWNVLISGYVQHDLAYDALATYTIMEEEGTVLADAVTFAYLLQACATVGALHEGKQLHVHIQESGLQGNLLVCNCLIHMYGRCRSLEDARRVFDTMLTKDVVTWNSLITGYVENGVCQEAFAAYDSMLQEGITAPSAVTFVCLLQACCSVGGLAKGKEIHHEISKTGLGASDLFVANALVDMYVKCGSMADAREVFDALPLRDVVTFNSLIAGYARQGESEVTFSLFDRMGQEEIQPNDVTFLSVLTVCSHVGLVGRGQSYFEAMARDHGISPTIEHYNCMVDLFGRAGQFDKVMETLKMMPCQADGVVWKCVLGACRKWGNVELARQAFEHAVHLEKNDPAAYILMSNIYASVNMPEEAKKIQAMRYESSAWKHPGQSWWTDCDGTMHAFVVGDKQHPGRQRVQANLVDLALKIHEEEYVVNIDN